MRSRRLAIPGLVLPFAPFSFGSSTRRALLLIAVLAVAPLAGCGIFRPIGSWVELAHDADAEPLAEAIVVFVAEAVTEPSATIALAPPPDDQAANLLTLKVREKLLARGYRLGDQGPQRLSYFVSSYGGQILLRASFRQTEISVLFARDGNGALRASAPLARRERML
jgi:hypothetical protein